MQLTVMYSPGTLVTILASDPDKLEVAAIESLNLLSHLVQGWADGVPQAETAVSGASTTRWTNGTWKWAKHDTSFTVSADGMTAVRSGNRHDYSCVMGGQVMNHGRHEWTMKVVSGPPRCTLSVARVEEEACRSYRTRTADRVTGARRGRDVDRT